MLQSRVHSVPVLLADPGGQIERSEVVSVVGVESEKAGIEV